MTGTFLNAGAIVLGAGVGTLLGSRLSAGIRGTVTDTLGIFVLVLGASDALTTFGDELSAALGSAAVLVILGSLLLGGVIGELIDIEGWLHRLGAWLRDRVVGNDGALAAVEADGDTTADGTTAGDTTAGDTTDGDTTAGGTRAAPYETSEPVHDPRRLFVEGFVVTSLIVCVGPLAILGSLQDGLTDGFELLAVKSMLDGFAALAFASVLGIGVAFAALPLVVLQGAITLAASALQSVLTPPMLAGLTATGGFLVMAIGVRLLDLRPIRVANLLPSLVLAPVVVALWP
jgi:uncharacterized protein